MHHSQPQAPQPTSHDNLVFVQTFCVSVVVLSTGLVALLLPVACIPAMQADHRKVLHRCEYRLYYAKLNGIPSGQAWESFCPGESFLPKMTQVCRHPNPAYMISPALHRPATAALLVNPAEEIPLWQPSQRSLLTLTTSCTALLRIIPFST